MPVFIYSVFSYIKLHRLFCNCVLFGESALYKPLKSSFGFAPRFYKLTFESTEVFDTVNQEKSYGAQIFDSMYLSRSEPN